MRIEPLLIPSGRDPREFVLCFDYRYVNFGELHRIAEQTTIQDHIYTQAIFAQFDAEQEAAQQRHNQVID